MKTNQKKRNEKETSRKHALLLLTAFFGTFGVSAGTVFFMLPQRTITDLLTTSDDPNIDPPTPSQAFINKLLESAKSGLTLDVNHLDFNIPGAVKNVEGTEVTTENRITNIEGKNPQIALSLEELSLQGINLRAELPLAYNGLKREVDLGLMGNGEVDKNLYIGISDIDGDAKDWTAGYQVDVKRYTSDIIDEETGGKIGYEYGRLSFILEDILEILSKGGINLNTYGKIGGAITGSNGSGASSDASSSSSINTQDLLDALNNIQESVYEGNTYFTLNLPLGGIEFSIGMGADKDFNLSSVDIPSKLSTETTQKLSATNDMTLALNADVYTVASGESYDWVVPEAWKSYKKLDDSLALFERVANLVVDPKFGLQLDVEMIHSKSGKEGTFTTFSRKPMEQAARLSLNGDVDLSLNTLDGAITGVNFNSAAADLAFTQLQKDENGKWVDSTAKQMLSAYIDNTDSSNAAAYINVADTLKVRTTKSVLDEVIGKFRSETVPSDPVEGAQEEKTNIQIDKVVDTLTQVIGILQGQDNFETPALLAGLKEKHYEAIVDMIDKVEINDNKIQIDLSLAGLGFNDAMISVILNGSADHSLASIEITSLKLNTLELNLALKTTGHTAKTPEEMETMNEWAFMNKLPTLMDPIAEIAKNKQISLGLQGTVSDRGTMDVYQDVAKTAGMDINGSINLDFSKEKAEGATNSALLDGAIDLTLTEKNASYYQDHNIKLDVANSAEDLTSTQNAVYLHYDSSNPANSADVENRTNPTNKDGVNGKFYITDAADILEGLINTITGADDRFGRISRLMAAPAEATFLSELTSGNYVSAIANYSILKEATIGEHRDVIVLNGSALGMDSDLTLALNFSSDASTFDNIEIGLSTGKDEATATDISFKLSFDKVTADTSFSCLDHEASYDDFSGILSLADYAVSTALLGLENGEGVSTYDIEGVAKIALGNYEAELARASMQASVEGARIKLHGELNDIPVIRGINAPDDERYFRPLEIGGSRDASFYYYSDGLENEDGELTTELLMTRHSDYGRLMDVNDSVKLNKEGAFKDDALSYLLQYFLGVDESLFADNGNETVAEPSTDAKAFHVEDLYRGFTKTVDGDDVSFEIRVNLNSLIGVSILNDIVLRIDGGTFGGFKALNGIHVDTGVSLFGSEGGRIKLVGVSLDLYLNNLRDGEYLNGWEKGEEAFEANFLHFENDGSYKEVGVYDDASRTKAWHHGVDPENAGHRNYYLGLSH